MKKSNKKGPAILLRNCQENGRVSSSKTDEVLVRHPPPSTPSTPSTPPTEPPFTPSVASFIHINNLTRDKLLQEAARFLRICCYRVFWFVLFLWLKG